MDQVSVNRLEALRPAIKREWEKLLRTEPALSPMANPDTLVFLMDETLAQLAEGLRARGAKGWSQRSDPMMVPLQRRCPCGLNPLLNYYATGELAVHAVGATRLEFTEVQDALACFHTLAQREIDTLCSVCRHRRGSACRNETAMTGSAR